jgi:hypothetical protein
MELNIKLTADDYIKANFVHMRPRPFIKWVGYFLLFVAVVVLGCSGFDAIVHRKGFITPIVLAASLAYLVFSFGIYYPKRIRKIFLQQKLLQQSFSFAVTDEAVSSKAEYGQATLTWDIFRKWKESKDLFLLYQSDVLFHMMPKRCFSSAEDISRFRKLLYEKMGPAQP